MSVRQGLRDPAALICWACIAERRHRQTRDLSTSWGGVSPCHAVGDTAASRPIQPHSYLSTSLSIQVLPRCLCCLQSAAGMLLRRTHCRAVAHGTGMVTLFSRSGCRLLLSNPPQGLEVHRKGAATAAGDALCPSGAGMPLLPDHGPPCAVVGGSFQ